MEEQINAQDQNDQDKTVVFNSGKDRQKTTGQDKTKTDSDVHKDSEPNTDVTDKTTIGSSRQGKDEDRNLENPTEDISKKINTKDKKSFPIGAVASGVAGAGLGVVAGTIYSDEIKKVFTTSIFDTPENLVDDVPEVTELASESVADGASEIDYTFSDQNGVYELNILDFNSDGEMDAISADATLVDGSVLSFTAAGDSLDSIFNNEQLTFAQPLDYVSFYSDNDMPGFDPAAIGAQSYHIQSGDTLSDIAAANNTSIGDVLALNPQISDENMIYSGDDILIPSSDSIINPFAGWAPDDSVLTEPFVDESLVDASTNQVEYAAMDWQSFEDEPLDEYSSSLNGTDFAAMQTPESYLDYSNDIDSLDFI